MQFRNACQIIKFLPSAPPSIESFITPNFKTGEILGDVACHSPSSGQPEHDERQKSERLPRKSKIIQTMRDTVEVNVT